MEERKTKQLLKVVVGSQAHGLANENSDFDYRGVFVVPTTDLLKIGSHIEQTNWIEGKEDDTSWEIGKFLLMATKCNPTVLETFLAPRVDEAEPKGEGPGTHDVSGYYEEPYTLGDDLRDLFPYVWNSVDVKNAFIGYGVNQRKKFFDNKDKRAPKYAAAYLRVLFNCEELLLTGTFHVDLRGREIYDQAKRFKEGNFTQGEVIQACWDMETRVIKAFNKNPDKQTDVKPVNEFLLRVRKKYWDW